MSYPGYPPYSQGPPGQPPYPQQYPGGVPYPGADPNSVPGGYPHMGGAVYMPQPYVQMGYPNNPPYQEYAIPTYASNNYAPPPSYPSQGGPAFSQGAPAYTPQGVPSYTPQGAPAYPAYVPVQAPYQAGYNQIHRVSATVVPANPFNPQDDAEVLRKAMKGFGTDEKAIINVLTRRTNAQRLQIGILFKTLYGKDLIQDIKSELTGNFEILVVAMLIPLAQFYAQELHDAINGLGTDEDVLIEVLCALPNDDIREIREIYYYSFGRTLEGDLKGDTGGTFKRLMISLCNASRDESTITNPPAATCDAQALFEAGERQWGTDESTFNMVLCQRSYGQLRLVFQEYQRISGRDIEDSIKNEFSGDAEEGLLAIVRSVKNKAGFFAKRLHKAMKGLGTNDRDLIRLIITRSEIDMGDIKREYQAHYGESLCDAIRGDCSGDYKKCLLALIGEA